MAFLPKGFEWVIILFVVLIIFGPKNLPKLGRAIKRGIANLRGGLGKKKNEQVEAEAEVIEDTSAEETVVEAAVEEAPAQEAQESQKAEEPQTSKEPEEDSETVETTKETDAKPATKTVKRKVVKKKVEK